MAFVLQLSRISLLFRSMAVRSLAVGAGAVGSLALVVMGWMVGIFPRVNAGGQCKLCDYDAQLIPHVMALKVDRAVRQCAASSIGVAAATNDWYETIEANRPRDLVQALCSRSDGHTQTTVCGQVRGM